MTKIEKDELLNLNREVLEKIREKVCERLSIDKDKTSYLHEKYNHVRFTTEDFSKGFAPLGNHHYETCIHYAQSEDNRASVGIHFEHNNNSLNQAFFAYSTVYISSFRGIPISLSLLNTLVICGTSSPIFSISSERLKTFSTVS